jgi:hypothetical protein
MQISLQHDEMYLLFSLYSIPVFLLHVQDYAEQALCTSEVLLGVQILVEDTCLLQK